MKNSGEFTIIDFHISHRFLLLRNTTYPEPYKYENIDIAFEKVFYLEIPHKLDGLEIYEGGAEEINYVNTRIQDELELKFGKVFVLISQGKKYYIGASSYLISNNNLLENQTSLFPGVQR